jgi:hypothetical protein
VLSSRALTGLDGGRQDNVRSHLRQRFFFRRPCERTVPVHATHSYLTVARRVGEL